MWQSCLRRSLPPLLSQRRRHSPARRGSILPGRSACRILPLSRTHTTAAAPGTWPHFCNGCGADQQLQRRRHLYAVLDDWQEGFSVYKIGLDDLLADDGAGDELRRLRNPILRLGFRTVGSHPCFHALGSNIVVTNDSRSPHEGDDGLTLIYDTETTALDVGRSLPPDLRGLYHAVAAAGNKLYALSSHNISRGSLPYLCQILGKGIRPCSGHLDGDEEEDMAYCLRPQRRWSWERRATPPPFKPDHYRFLSARALHPDGRTVFASFKSSVDRKETSTFSLDTESGEWTRRGDWCLPFSGQAYYDGDLGAWVGTRTIYDKEDDCGHEHLCTCDVPEDSVTPAPAWTVAKEKLTFLEAPLKTLGHILLPTGGIGGAFVLVEPAVRQGFTYKSFLGDGDKCLLRVTMFRAKYGRGGELLAVPLRPGRSYLFSRYVGHFGPYAFWL